MPCTWLPLPFLHVAPLFILSSLVKKKIKKILSYCFFFFLTGAGWQNGLSNSPLICYYPAFRTQKCRFPHYLP